MHLTRNRLGPALDGKLARVIVGVAGKGTDAGKGGDVEDQAAAPELVLAHGRHGAHRHAGRAEEERLHLVMGLLVCGSFGVSRERVAGVVDDKVNVVVLSKVSRRRLEGIVDRGGRGDVEGKLEDAGVVVGKV